MEVNNLPRPIKLRKVCCLPENSKFGPLDKSIDSDDYLIMEIDEYEAIRLIDLEGFSQEECAIQMNVSRATVQRIITEARKKLAESLVSSKVLLIEGGEYLLCDGVGNACGRGCHKHRNRGRYRGNI